MCSNKIVHAVDCLQLHLGSNTNDNLYIKEDVCPSVCLPSDEDQRLNHRADWAQIAYIYQVGLGDVFHLGVIPIGL